MFGIGGLKRIQGEPEVKNNRYLELSDGSLIQEKEIDKSLNRIDPTTKERYVALQEGCR